MALIKASRSDVENCRHSKRTLGLALQAAAAAVCTVAAASSALACVEFSNPFGKSFPASASACEMVWNFGNADDGRLGLVLGSNDADATETASKRTNDRMAWEWDLKGGKVNAENPREPAAISTSEVHHLLRIRAAQNTICSSNSSVGVSNCRQPRSSDHTPWGFALVEPNLFCAEALAVTGLQAI